MKDALKIYKRDLKNIFSNYAALIVVIALCIIPSLYAWFNIKASWDPYSQEATSGIKIGVVNKDSGAMLNGKEMKLGDMVIDELKKNTQMGWQFVSEEEATKSLEEGKYYATLIIPPEFSTELTSILNEDVKKGQIIYNVNEKINAIAPKLTDKGATALQEKISKELIATVSDTVLTMGKETGIELENQIPKITVFYDKLVEIQSHFNEINDTVDKASDGAGKLKVLIKDVQDDIPLVQETLNNAKSLSGDVKTFLVTSKEGVTKISPTIKQDIGLIRDIAKEVADGGTGLKDLIVSGSDKAPEVIDSLIDKTNGLSGTTKSLINILESLNKINPSKPLTPIIESLQEVDANLDAAIVALNTIKDEIAGGKQPDLSVLDKVINLGTDINNITSDLYNRFDSDIVGKITIIFDEAYTVANNALSVIQEAENKLPQVVDILNTAYAGVDKGIEGISYVKENLPEAEGAINNLISKVQEVKDSKELDELINLLKGDIAVRSDFLANPIELKENKLFPMGNYGTSMTPFYTVLSLWVGLLLLSSIFTVEAQGEYSPSSEYFGKLLFFLTVAIIQGLIASLGDLYLLKIYCVNPGLFVLGSIFTSVVFTFIVYSAVSVFGNVGKVIGIILLVLQVAGSGGTFPIQLTPKFFQVINPFLPFTYAISFARESIGGVVHSVLIKDIVILTIYIVTSILIALLLKKPINKASEGFKESFKKSGMGEH